MPNQYVNKVVYGGSPLIDLTDTTATAADVAQGVYFYLANGERVQGAASVGIDGDNLPYGGAYVGTAVVGSAVLTS